MTQRSFYYFFTAIMMVAVFGVGLSSCKKKKPSYVYITVKDASGDVVPGAMVRLYGQSTTTPPTGPVVRIDTAYANESGVAFFDYTDTFKLGSAGLFVLNIEARQGSLSGAGIVKIEPEKSTEETVYVQ
jgi:hypothetical protein